jgi:hypothetical protein
MANNSDSKIYIMHYKKGKVLKNDSLYQPLMCGNNLRNEEVDGSILGDDSGENISQKNPFFSELTGTYWVWKNKNHAVTGCCHYRRFYTVEPEPLRYRIKRFFYYPIGLAAKRFGLIYTQDVDFFKSRILNQEQLAELLTRYDAILPQARKLRYTVEEHYRRYHDIHDLEILREILEEKYPDYLPEFEAVLKGKRLYANNMFILKREDYLKFMPWWFDMIFEFERRTDMGKYVGYQKRIIGFIAERLLTVWFKKNKLNCKELQLIYFKSFKSE